MIHGGTPFSELSVGQEFRFPAAPKPGQRQSDAYVKLGPRRYAARRNQPAHGHPWNTYVHEVSSPAVHVAPRGMLSAGQLAEVLRAVDETKAQDRGVRRAVAAGGGALGGVIIHDIREVGHELVGGGGAKLTYQEKRAAPSSDFALETRRMFYIGDATHAADAMSRLSRSWSLGHLSQTEYRQAHDRIVAAETRFGIQHHGGHEGPIDCPYPPRGKRVLRRGSGGRSRVAGGGALLAATQADFEQALAAVRELARQVDHEPAVNEARELLKHARNRCDAGDQVECRRALLAARKHLGVYVGRGKGHLVVDLAKSAIHEIDEILAATQR